MNIQKSFFIILLSSTIIYSEENQLTIKLHPSIGKSALIEVKNQDNQIINQLSKVTPDNPFTAKVPANHSFYVTKLQFEGDKAHVANKTNEGLGPISSGNHILCLEENNIKCPPEIRKSSWENIALHKEK